MGKQAGRNTKLSKRGKQVSRNGDQLPQASPIRKKFTFPIAGLKFQMIPHAWESPVSEDYGMTWKLAWKDCMSGGGYVYSPNYKKGWIDERFGPYVG